MRIRIQSKVIKDQHMYYKIFLYSVRILIGEYNELLFGKKHKTRETDCPSTAQTRTHKKVVLKCKTVMDFGG